MGIFKLRSGSRLVLVGALLLVIVAELSPAGYAAESEPGTGSSEISSCEKDFLSRLDARVVESLTRQYGILWSKSTIADEEKAYSVWLESAQATIDEIGLASDEEKSKMNQAFHQWQALPKLLYHPIYTQILLEELGKKPFFV